MHRCTKCRSLKPTSEFRRRPPHHPQANKLFGPCRRCRAYYEKVRVSKTPRARLSSLLSHARSRAARKRITFDLTVDDMLDILALQNHKCALSGRHMTSKPNDVGFSEAMSIDRIDSDRGYTLDNVWLVCSRANSMKMEGTIEDLVGWCHDIIEHSDEGRRIPPSRVSPNDDHGPRR